MAEKQLGNPSTDIGIIADLAEIPIESRRKFLHEVALLAMFFTQRWRLDTDRHKIRAAISEVKTASNRLLRALEHLKKRGDAAPILDCYLDIEMYRDWSDAQWQVWQTGDWRSVAKETLLPDIKDRILTLNAAAEHVERLAKRGENRTKGFIWSILRTVEMYDGNLTYDKNSHIGTLADVYEFFRARMPSGSWTDLSPSTLQRLKSNKRLR